MVAAAYAESGSDITLFHVAADGDVESAQSFLEQRQEALAESDIDVDIGVESGEDISEGILDYARDGNSDSIIIGAAGEGILRRVLFGDIPETVGAEFGGEVVMVRKHRPVQSAIKRLVGKWIGKGAKATNFGE
jgi:nucleotide-binding universal stress UspA family protein